MSVKYSEQSCKILNIFFCIDVNVRFIRVGVLFKAMRLKEITERGAH